MLLAGIGLVLIARNCDLGRRFSLYGPPSRPITSISQFDDKYII